MALVVKDRVRETSTTAGTGTITLAGAVSSFQSFAAIGDGNTTYYTITDSSTGDWEVGIGTYTASGTTLSRDTVLESSNSGSLVNFSANSKDVFVTYPAERSVYTDGAGTAITPATASVLGVSSGGTGQTTTQAAINALAGAATSGQYLRGDGTNVVMSAIQAGDVPTLNQNTTGTASNVTGIVAVANGGTGATTAAAALTNLGAQPASTAITTSNIGSQSVNYATSSGSATSATTATNQSGGTVNATSILSSAGVSDTYSGIRVVNPGGGALIGRNGAQAGAIKIKLPTASLNSDTMLRLTVKIYEYNTGYSRTFEIGGYNYSAGNWYNWFATQSSQSGGDMTVRFGQDSTSDCIWIGETSSTWSYPQVFITDVQCGYGNTTQAMWSSGWAISFVTAFDTVEQSTVAYRPLSSGNYNSYAPSLTGSGASGTWGISITGSSASATSATYLNSSNYIQKTGSSGNLNTDFSNTPAGTIRHQGDDANLTNSPGNTWWFYENMRHSNGSNLWGVQVAWGWEDNANRLATRNVSGGSYGSWVYYLNSDNYNSYVLAGVATSTWNTVGCYGLMKEETATVRAPNATITGSTAFYASDCGGSNTANYGSGTWRCMGTKQGTGSSSGRTTLWIRIA